MLPVRGKLPARLIRFACCAHRAAAALLPPRIAQELQRQGAGGSLLLFKHSVVVVDGEDRAWPVQVGRGMPQHVAGHAKRAGRSVGGVGARAVLLSTAPGCMHPLVRGPCPLCAGPPTLCFSPAAPAAPAVQYEGFMSAGQRHLRLGAGWRYLCRANNVTVGAWPGPGGA